MCLLPQTCDLGLLKILQCKQVAAVGLLHCLNNLTDYIVQDNNAQGKKTVRNVIIKVNKDPAQETKPEMSRSHTPGYHFPIFAYSLTLIKISSE